MPLNRAGVIFDLDGTLIDSLPVIHRSIDAVTNALDLPRADRAVAQSFVGGGVPVAMTRLLAWAGADPALHGEATAIMLDAYGREPPEANVVYPGVRDALSHLAARGVPMGLCTNKPGAPTRTIIEALDLGPFDAVICGDSLPRRKPDQAPLVEAARLLGAAPAACLYVGDSEIDHAAAAAAPMPFAFFEGGYLNAPLAEPAPEMRFADWSDFRV